MRSVYGICVYYTLFPTVIYAIIRHFTIYAVYIRIYAYMYTYAYIHRPALDIRYTLYIQSIRRILKIGRICRIRRLKVYGGWFSIRSYRISSKYTDKCRMLYGRWYTAHDFDTEPYAIVTLNSVIPTDLYICGACCHQLH